MRLWGKIYKDGQKLSDGIVDIDINKRTELRKNENLLTASLAELAHAMDLERPVIVNKHLRDLYDFGRAVFHSNDFMETVDFDRFVVELIPDA